jgi:hypothetical protein
MNNIVFVMQIVHTQTQLTKPRYYFMLGDFLEKISFDELVQVAFLSQLKYQYQVLLLLESLVYLDNVWMIEGKEKFGLEIEVIV